jgi:gamma-glutamylcyclotransferase (GGCT)/AIG2-like uncharacterized protein YtfP
MADAMHDPGTLLFTYGTLMLTTGIPAVDDAMRNAGTSLGRAYVHGRLFDLGDYPGAVPVEADGRDEDAPKVWGHLLRLKDPAALFAVLDPYEGFDAGNRPASEFVRETARIALAKGAIFEGQIYWYNFPSDGKALIDTGDFLAHWAAKGKPRQVRQP